MKRISIPLFLCALAFSSTVLAQEAKPLDLHIVVDKTQGRKVPPASTAEVPEWLKRINFNVQGGSEQKPVYYFESVQPLLGTENKDVVFFNQSRMATTAGRPTYNTGLGLRTIWGEHYLVGVNSFYDYQDLHKHSRAGVGIETITDRGLEARLNSYLRVSRQRLVAEDSLNEYYEKVANGLDWELGAPLPFLPALKVFGGGEWYDFEHFKNKYGWQARAEYSPVKYSRLGFKVFDDTQRNKVGYQVEGAIALPFTSFNPRDIIKDFKGASEAYPKIDLRDKMLDRVVRNNDITVIKSIKSKATGLTVQAARLN